MFKLNYQSRLCRAVIGATAWMLLGISLGKIFNVSFLAQVFVAICNAGAGAIVWYALDLDAPRSDEKFPRAPKRR